MSSEPDVYQVAILSFHGRIKRLALILRHLFYVVC